MTRSPSLRVAGRLPAVFLLVVMAAGVAMVSSAGVLACAPQIVPVRLANISTADQQRWTAVSLPTAVARSLPVVCRFQTASGSMLAVRGRTMGDMVQQYYVRGAAAAGDLTAGTLGGSPAQLRPFRWSSWIAEAPLQMATMGLRVRRYGRTELIPFHFAGVVEDHPVRKVWRFAAGPRAGVWAELFLTFWHDQDVVDMEGRWGWHDFNDSAWFTHFESVELLMARNSHLYFADRTGLRAVAGGWELFSQRFRDGGKFPHAMAPHFYGVVLPGPVIRDTGTAQRRAWLEAAKHGPLLMTGDRGVWDGAWFSFGQVPQLPQGYSMADAWNDANSADANFRRHLTTNPNNVDFWAERPLANRFNTGSTGSQAPFGATKGAFAVTVGDPRALWAYLYSSTDYGMRTFHYREPNGGRVLAANHPGWVSRSGQTDPRFGSDLLGKSRQRAYGWDLGRHGPNGQHRGQNYMWAALALTGSRLLEEVAAELLESDSAGAAVSPHPSAPRSMRAMQDWAKIHQLMSDPEYRARTLWLSEDIALASWELGWAGGGVNGPVTPLEVNNPDPRVLPNDRFWVPWNESLGCLGLLEACALAVRSGRIQVANRYAQLLLPVARNIVVNGTAVYPSGERIPLNGVAWLDGGQRQSVAYYTIPRNRASTRPGDINLLLGTGGWWWWNSGAVHAVLALSPTGSAEWNLARSIKDTYLVPGSWAHSEWVACGIR